MFNFRGLDNLALAIGVGLRDLHEVLDDFDTNPAALVRELTLWRADQSKKPRDVIAIRGRWRHIQRRIYTKLLLPQFHPSRYSHGGVKCRSALTNARVHLGNSYAFVTDISGFFPAISCFRVNKLFLELACTYEVARALTRFCTYDYHLALGLITSPIIANELFKPIDSHVARACRSIGLSYSRFVDDITISGQFDLADSGIEGTVRDIIERHGFTLAGNKTKCGKATEIDVTGVRLKRDHLDAPRHFMTELDRMIADHESLSRNCEFMGPLLTESELFGKARFACSLNPGRRRSILSRLATIKWDHAMNYAATRGLLRSRDRFTKRGEERPDCTFELGTAAGAENYRRYAATHSIDPSIPPF